MVDMKQAPYCGTATIRRHSSKVDRHGDLESEICSPLAQAIPISTFLPLQSVESYSKRSCTTKCSLQVT